jgi:predicted nucleic acid-binding Zn ribbon protein
MEIRRCPVCQKDFEPSYPDQKFCSDQCRLYYYKRLDYVKSAQRLTKKRKPKSVQRALGRKYK